MKNKHYDNVIYIEEWQKRQQTFNTGKLPDRVNAERASKEMEIFARKAGQESDPENDDNFLSGMLIW